MSTRLDHAFIMTEPGAPDADALIECGMIEGTPNTHPGQGTANRRFFFRDFGLELIYFTDPDEARSGPGRVIRGRDRFESEEGSPFGLVFRASNDRDIADFPGFPYQPVYFEEGQFFIVGDNADLLAEPNCVLMPRNLPKRPPQTLSPAPFESLTGLRLHVPVARMSPALAAAAAVDRVDVVTKGDNLMELEFGGGRLGRSHDLRPDLPLVIRW
jgi:hypothetical protein